MGSVLEDMDPRQVRHAQARGDLRGRSGLRTTEDAAVTAWDQMVRVAIDGLALRDGRRAPFRHCLELGGAKRI